MKVRIELLSTGQSFPLDVEASNTIGELKAKIHMEEGIPEHMQWLTFEGALLQNDGEPLSHCGIFEGATVGLILVGFSQS